MLAAASLLACAATAAPESTPKTPASALHPDFFPVTTQFSPVPDGQGWKGETGALSAQVLRDTIDNLRAHGFTGLYHPLPLADEQARVALAYAQSRGMVITHITSGFEGFGRDAPPAVCVYSPKYAAQARQAVQTGLAGLPDLPGLYNVFCYQDEPFHAGAKSFGYNEEVKAEFQKRYGYALPPALEPLRNDPRVWRDVLNFRSDYFPDGWRQVYRLIKEINPGFQVILTHDSHNTFGGGVGSNAELAVDDVFHWGGDFADTFVFDIYPYMMFDFRYGQCGKLPKPRMSQFHYAMGQMRNLTRAYGKRMGFWFGTCNPAWFKEFMGPELTRQTWAERETSATAVAQGADFILTGLNVPADPRHWDELGQGLRLIQAAGSALLDAPRTKAQACFLFPRTQYLQLQEEFWNVGLSYELFLRAFGELDVLHEEQIRDDRLEGYRILALFDVKLLPKETAGHIAAFVRNGGVLIADCVPQLDACRQPLDLMSQLIGVRNAATNRLRRTGNWVPYRTKPPAWGSPHDDAEDLQAIPRDTVKGDALGLSFDLKLVSPRPSLPTEAKVLLRTAAGQPALLHRSVGRGEVFLLGFCAQDTYFQTWQDGDERTRDQLYALLHSLTRQANVRPRVRSSNPDIEASLRANAKEGFLFVINHEAVSPRTEISLAGLDFPVGRIVDLANGNQVPHTPADGAVMLPVDTASGVTRLFHVLPAPR
jgi:hypothetical protein